ncbi:helix-turn-helix domain-containing protein [Adlercreutzia murintestinalis]|uniref:helix-turn-helix domain-containing protein n=1 Tax=Adlercreutzia murintestinalis TaxID=2941325 RepID=UPI002040C81E|nr:helix-turn-helix transcriptional regulator [Adlercreutzia murintestinalis]
MELAQQIRHWRTERGLRQDELAEAIFVSRQTVSNWENDKTYPDVQSLVLLSQLFNVSIDELIQGDVAVMRRTMEEDSRKMRWLSTAMVIFLLLAVAFFIGLAAAWRDPLSVGNLTKGDVAGTVVFLPLYGLAMACALWIERIKCQHNLVTYREIMAFANGEPAPDAPEGHAFARNHQGASILIKVVFSAAIGAVCGLGIYKLVG